MPHKVNSSNGVCLSIHVWTKNWFECNIMTQKAPSSKLTGLFPEVCYTWNRKVWLFLNKRLSKVNCSAQYFCTPCTPFVTWPGFRQVVENFTKNANSVNSKLKVFHFHPLWFFWLLYLEGKTVVSAIDLMVLSLSPQKGWNSFFRLNLLSLQISRLVYRSLSSPGSLQSPSNNNL